MWTPEIVIDRITSGSLLPDSMFDSLEADELLDERDDDFDDDWVRAAQSIQSAWDRLPTADRKDTALNLAREVAFKRSFDASGGNHDLSATISDDFDLICRRGLVGVDSPFIAGLQLAYEAHRIPT